MAIPISAIEPLLQTPLLPEASVLQEVPGWQPEPLQPDVESLNGPQRTTAAARWAALGIDTHLGTANASRFALSLLAIAAPARLVESALEVARERVQHARIGFGLASAYADRPIGPRATAVLPPLPDHNAVFEEAIAVYCIGSTISAICWSEAHSQSEDPAVWEALGTLKDGAWKHTRMGWDIIAWGIHAGPPEMEQHLRTRIDAHISERLAQPLIHHTDLADPMLIEHGCPSAFARERLQRAILSQVIRPCIDQFLATSL